MFEGSLAHTPLNKARQIQARFMLLKNLKFPTSERRNDVSLVVIVVRSKLLLSKGFMPQLSAGAHGFPPGKATMCVDSLPVLLAPGRCCVL